MRVLHLVTRDVRRGAEIDALHINDALTSAGMPGTVVALAPADLARAPLGVPVLGPSPLHPRTLLALRRLARSHDRVVAHGSRTLPAARLALLGSSHRFVYRTIGVPGAWAPTAARRARVRWLLRGADAVAALGEGSRRDVLSLYRLPPHRVVAVGCSQPDGRFVPASAAQRAAARASLGVEADAEVVLVLAALSPEKRLHDALAAVGSVPGVVLLVAGDGPLRGELEQSVAARDRDRIRFLGQVEDVRPLLHAADVALLTSATEGVPGFLVQAGMSGLPSVATTVGYVDEVVADGATGRLVPVADVERTAAALREALRRRDEWGPAAARRCRDRFGSATTAARWHALLEGERSVDSAVRAT